MNTTTLIGTSALKDIKGYDFLVEQMKNAVQQTIDNGGWILVSPDGKMYKGDIERIAAVILTEHPLLKVPRG